MIGYCGLDCDQCGAFIATRNNDDALRIKVAGEWSKQYNAPIKPEHINCTGCQSAGIKTFYCDQLCEIRKCAMKRSVSTCAKCTEFSCSLVEEVLRNAPEARKTLEMLKER